MKWYGEIGFKEEIEEEPGVFVPTITTKKFYGDVLQLSWKEMLADKINSDLRVSNKISIVADPFLQDNFHKIAYISFGNAKWTVSNVRVDWPRVTLDLGELYLEEGSHEN